ATPIQMADATRAELLGAEATVRRIEADIRRTQAALQGDEALLGYSRIYAPIAGTVVSLEARPGQTLNATYQTPKLLRIADLSAMTVWTQVSEADIPRLRVGMEAVFTTLAQDGRQWRGTVRQVLPMPQPDPAAAEGGTATQPAVGAKAWRAAWRAMALNRVRTALTLLGIVAGVASVIVMLAIGRGAKEQVVRQMGALGAAILYVSGGVAPEGGVAGVVTLDDLAAVAELPEIARVMPVIGNPVMLRHGAYSRPSYVVASTADLPAIHRWPVALGRFHIAAENRELAPVVVLGSRLRQRLLPDVADPIGQLVLVDATPFEVIGVMSAKGAESGSENYDDQAFIPFDTGRARVFTAIGEPEYAVIEARSPQDAVAAEAAMRDLLRARHGRESFSIGNAAAKLQAAAESRNAMTLMLGLIAAVSLLVGGIGVMNVMLMTVRERTREIGIRMAVGARQRDIRRQFLTEAALVSVCGGAAGVALGLGIGTALLAAGAELVFSLTAILGAFGCAVATGLASGLMPARAAARLDPVAALSGG
ncbi:MAG: ABC transporter permease, partial [Castellaniella sp.]|uniref:ABC transporter permease n=1 Tax=Castellaniella sp. TaxID=1955812 RepID=UPI003C782B2D